MSLHKEINFETKICETLGDPFSLKTVCERLASVLGN